MILTDYYRMAKLQASKSKNRFDCIASTGGYEPFEQRAQRTKEKRFKFYLSDNTHIAADAKRRADKTITDTTHISSIYKDIRENHLLGYGDVDNTQDALLFIFNDDCTEIELLVARGLKNDQYNLYQLLTDGDLNSEIATLRLQAKPTNVNSKKG